MAPRWLLGISILLAFSFCFADYDDYGEDRVVREMKYTESKGDCECETEIYEADQEHGIIKSPHYPRFDGCTGRCIYIIKPHPNKTVSLYTNHLEMSENGYLIVYALLEDEKYGTIRIPHAKIRRSRSFYYRSEDESFPGFVSAKNAGFEIHFSSTTAYYTYFKISFDRYDVHDGVCGYPLVIVNSEETIVQKDQYYSSASGCVYFLKPIPEQDPEGGDMVLIDIKDSIQNMVSVRYSKNGKLKYEPVSFEPRTQVRESENLEIISHKDSRADGRYKFAQITARLVRKVCDCFPKEMTVNNTFPLTIRSPGYPEFNCRPLDCTADIIADFAQFQENQISLFEISSRILKGTSAILRLKSDNQEYYGSSTPNEKLIEETFVIKEQSLHIDYQTSNFDKISFFEINVARILVEAECICSLYNDKEINRDNKNFDVEIHFPNHCTYIYCSFHFSLSRRTRTRALIEFSVEGAMDEDRVTLKSFSHEEVYEGTMLHKTTQYEILDETHFAFFRKHVSTNDTADLKVKWAEIENGRICDNTIETINLAAGESQIVTSPGYPERYHNNQHCEYGIFAPDDCRVVMSVDEIRIENFHDFVTIYLGNYTDAHIFKRFTAHVSHQVFNITSTPILMVFSTDQSATDRGFHITFTAIPLNTEQDTWSNTTKLMLTAFVLILIVVALFGVYAIFIWRKRQLPTNNRESENTEISSVGNQNQPTAENPNQRRGEISNIEYIFN